MDMMKGPPSAVDPSVPEYYELSERITKTRRGGKNDGRPLPGKTYADHEHQNFCPVRLLLNFESRKTAHQNRPNSPYILTVSPKAERAPDKNVFWFTDGPMGKHMIGDLLKQGVKATGVDLGPLKITARSARKTMCQAAADSICSPEFTSKVMGHKSLDSKLTYMKIKDPAHKATSLAITRTIAGQSENMFSDLYAKTSAAKRPKVELPATVTSGSCNEEQLPAEKVGRSPIIAANQPLNSVSPPQLPHPVQNPTFAPFPGYGAQPPFFMASPPQFFNPHQFYPPQQYQPCYPPPQTMMAVPTPPPQNMMAVPTPPPQNMMAVPTMYQPHYHNPSMFQQGPRQMMVPVLTDVTNNHSQTRVIQLGENQKNIQIAGYDQENMHSI